MLHPSLTTSEAMSELSVRWQTTRSLRIAPLLAEDTAAALLDAVRRQRHTLHVQPPPANFSYQYWIYDLVPEPVCDHVLCRFGRWLFADAAAWVSQITGIALDAHEDRVLLSTLYSKGSYLDAHNDYDGVRQVAYVFGLTPPGLWPAERGGHLEFLAVEPDTIRITERRPPGWNSLDLFDVRTPEHLHRVPIVTEHGERRAISGWFYRRAG